VSCVWGTFSTTMNQCATPTLTIAQAEKKMYKIYLKRSKLVATHDMKVEMSKRLLGNRKVAFILLPLSCLLLSGCPLTIAPRQGQQLYLFSTLWLLLFLFSCPVTSVLMLLCLFYVSDKAHFPLRLLSAYNIKISESLN